MKRILALIITICATSHATDWYVGARTGHAFVGKYGYGNSESPIEGGAYFGFYKGSFGASIGVDYANGDRGSDVHADSLASLYYNTYKKGVKENNWYYSLCANYRKDFGKLEAFAGVGIGLRVYSRDGNTTQSTGDITYGDGSVWFQTYRTVSADGSGEEIGGVANAGLGYKFTNGISGNVQVNCRSNRQSIIPEIGVAYTF